MGNLNKNKNIKEVVAICDQLDGAVTKCDLKNINIESLIHIVRVQKVMLDSDLAMLYGVTTSRLNEQVKRNINRFPDDFMFQLTKEEWSALRSQFAILEDLKSQNAISNLRSAFQSNSLSKCLLRDVFGMHGLMYLLGASVKDMGAGMCAVTKMEVSPELILGLIK